MEKDFCRKKKKRNMIKIISFIALLTIGCQSYSFGTIGEGEYTETELNDAYDSVNYRIKALLGHGIEKKDFHVGI